MVRVIKLPIGAMKRTYFHISYSERPLFVTILTTVVIMLCISVNGYPLAYNNNNYRKATYHAPQYYHPAQATKQSPPRTNRTDEGPHEEALATCSVHSLEPFANITANATLSRRLVGVCSSKELSSAVHHLENIITQELQKIWMTVKALQHQLEKPSPRSTVFRYLPSRF